MDDLENGSGLDLVRELHRHDDAAPIVLVADITRRRIPLEEVSIGWNGCYILRDKQSNFIQSAHSWIMHALQVVEQERDTSRRGSDSSENRELLRSQRLESVGMLASGIAHDFNNILMAILGNASIAKDKIGRDHEAQRFLNIIEQCAERASALSTSLMRYARGEKSDWIPIYLPDHVDELLNIISTGLPGHVMIEKEFEKVQPVEGDATKLQQVIMNLCLNAGDAMNERKVRSGGQSYMGVLSIGIHPAEPSQQQISQHAVDEQRLSRGFVRMDISDNGIGMNQNTLQTIFRPFFTTKKSGRGLGLSSVQGIIEEQGGFIDVVSEPGVGTTFSVYLPCCENFRDEDSLLSEMLSEPAVLVVESDEEMRRLLALNLQNTDYQVLLVANVDEALAVFLEHQSQISLILIGLAGSLMQSSRDLESLRRVNESTPIVVTTELEREELQPLFEAELATDYVHQPFKPDVLVRVIRDVIRRSGRG
ncbi:hypothetical protein KDL44_02100 [bacterium]|nr:hypothetical protein [bacterium]